MNIDATFTKNQIASIKYNCANEVSIGIRVEGTRLRVGDYDGPPLLDHDGKDPDLRKLVNQELHKRNIKLVEATPDDEVDAAVAVIKNYQQLADVATIFKQAREQDSPAPLLSIGGLQSGAPPHTESALATAVATIAIENDDEGTGAAQRLADKIEHAFQVAKQSEMPEELRGVAGRIPKGCNVVTFVEASIEACGVPGCNNPFQAACVPAVVDRPETRVYQDAPDLLSQFVAASATAVGVMGRQAYAHQMRNATPDEALARAAEEAARHAAELERASPPPEPPAELWDGLEVEANFRGVYGAQLAKVLVGGMTQWGIGRDPTGKLRDKEWPWANPAASLPVYSLVGAFLDEWNRAVVYAKHFFSTTVPLTQLSKYARATADLAAALGALVLTAQREHDDYVGAEAGECERPERPWREHIKERTNEQMLVTWLHLVWKEAAGCMWEEQHRCWERVQYFYNFRMKRGIRARPTDVQLRELRLLAYKHEYMVRMYMNVSHEEDEDLPSVDIVDILRFNAKGMPMAHMAQVHFDDEAIEDGEKAAAGDKLSIKALDNLWRVCVARAEYDRSDLGPYPVGPKTIKQASQLYGWFPRAQGWAPVETKNAQELGMGLYTRYICANCAKWAPEAPVCPGCKSIRFCSDRCRKEAMGAPMKATADENTTYSNSLAHAEYCDGSNLVPSVKATSAKFVFPTAVNIYRSHVNDAIRMLAEHGITNMNVLVHCTRRIDVGRDEIDPPAARMLLAACTNAAAAMRDRECMQYVHLLQWLPLFWTLFAPISVRPCKEAICEMLRTPRQFATTYFEVVVSWAPVLLRCVHPISVIVVARDGASRPAPNSTHNIPILVLSTLWGILRLRPTDDACGFHTAFWDGMGRQLTNALIVVLLSLEQHECRLEHNLRSLPDLILRILNYLSARVQVQPTFQQVQRCIQAIGRCGWSRLRSHLALGWVRCVRLALSDRRTVSQSEWSALEAMVSQPSGAYYSNFQVPVTWDESMRKLKRPPCEVHTNPNNFVALENDPPDTLAAEGDPEHAAYQSDNNEEPQRAPDRPQDPTTVRVGSKNARKRQAAKRIQRAWMRSRVVHAATNAIKEATLDDHLQRLTAAEPIKRETVVSLGGHAGAAYRPNEWIDIVGPCWDTGVSQTYADFKATYFGGSLNAHLAKRPQQALKLA